MKVNGVDHYDLNVIDHITKYTTAHLFVAERSLEKCVEFLSQIKTNCYNQILYKYYIQKHKRVKDRELITFVFDGFANYENAWSKLFYRVTNGIFGISIKLKNRGLKHNNNHIERYNGSIKDRIKTMRGGFFSFKNAEAFMNLKDIIYNFVKPHQGLKGKTPSQAAEIKLELGRMKLLGLIKYMAKNSRDD